VAYTIVGPKITGEAVDFREDTILTASDRISDQLQLWDYRTKKLLHTFKWDEDAKVFLPQRSSQTPPSTAATSAPTLTAPS
jgi:hypothetical protein